MYKYTCIPRKGLWVLYGINGSENSEDVAVIVGMLLSDPQLVVYQFMIGDPSTVSMPPLIQFSC